MNKSEIWNFVQVSRMVDLIKSLTLIIINYIDGNLLATVDDAGKICVFGYDKLSKKTMKGTHDTESIPTLTFTKDSRIMLTGCTMGNIRFFACDDFDGD